VAVVLTAALVACDGSITGVHGNEPAGAGPGGSQNGGSTGSDGGVVLSSELPCAAYDVLSAYCWTCHGATPAGGAPQSLATLAALQAPAPGNPTATNGARAVVRMQSTTSPMPPAPNTVVPAPEETAFDSWVSAGMPGGSCVTDGGVPPPVDAGPPPPPDPLGAAPTCTSQSTWTGGARGSSNMEPGRACITCHTQQGGPSFDVGGTVYPTGHEPDDCNGSAAGGAVVTVTDALGVTASFVAGSVSGNFHGSAQLTFPITASVTFDGKTRGMTTAVPTGDCNSCHTQNGASSAPGRITLPP
jgi:mono/diheme cytochrome c family protein